MTGKAFAVKMIELHALGKRYGETVALRSIDLQVNQGDVYGLVGVPRSGKTTLLKIIAGYMAPTSGSMALLEGDEDALDRIGADIGGPALLPRLSAYDNLMAAALAAGVIDPPAHCAMLLRRVGLSEDAQGKAGSLSPASQRMLGVALALVGLPDMVLLDEPFKGMGLRDAREIALKLHAIAQEMGLTMMVSAQAPSLLTPLVTRFGFLELGQIVREMNAETVAQGKRDVLTLRAIDAERAVALLDRFHPQASVSVRANGTIEIRNCTAEEVGRLMRDNGEVVLELTTRRGSADDVFSDLLESRKSHV